VHHTEAPNQPKTLQLASIQTALIALKPNGNLEYFDLSNIQHFMLNPIGYNINLSTSKLISPNILPKMDTMRSFNGDLVLLNTFQAGNAKSNNTNKLVLYECLVPYLKEDDSGVELT
jgi:hypothetical protein